MLGAWIPWLLLLQYFSGIGITTARTLAASVVPEPYFGDFIGTLPDKQGIGIKGDVYIVNGSCIQVLNFTYGAQAPDLFFWLDKASEPTSSGQKLTTFEFGSHALKKYSNSRVVLSFPDFQIKDYKSFGLYCHAFSKSFGSLIIPEDVSPPEAEFADGVIVGTEQGKRYNVMSGPVLIMDRRTVKIYGFHFNGERAPDGYFFVGRGPKPNRPSDGIKVGIRGRDTNFITSMSELYTGNRDLILELPESHDIYGIDWISVYCYRFGVDFGHIKIAHVSHRIPPYVPLQKKFDEAESPLHEPWPVIYLLGNEHRKNFTFQLGPPGGDRGYEAIATAKPHEYVWYVNGYMIPELWLERGRTYTFIVEGGMDAQDEDFNNPLYISNEPFGGYKNLAHHDKELVKTYAGMQNGLPIEHSAGRLCLWSAIVDGDDPNVFPDLQSYRDSLRLSCESGQAGEFQWTPDENTPDIVYYQSYTSYRMGWKIVVTDEIPKDLPDFKEKPYRNDIWIDPNLVTEIPPQQRPLQTQHQKSSVSSPLSSFFYVLSLTFVVMIVL